MIALGGKSSADCPEPAAAAPEPAPLGPTPKPAVAPGRSPGANVQAVGVPVDGVSSAIGRW